jgi:hypothetical protein
MSDLALFLVRTGFLVLMWIFVFTIIGVIRADLFGQRVVSRVAEANAPKVVSAPIISNQTGTVPVMPNPVSAMTGPVPATAARVATHLVITEGPRAGFTLRLNNREITLGRAENSDLVIDDEYASTHHAKLVNLNDEWLLQDLNSTNGTYVQGNRVGTPIVLRPNTSVKIGKTVFELRA